MWKVINSEAYYVQIYSYKALEIFLNVVGPDHFYVADVSSCMASIYKDQLRYPEALDNFKNSLRIYTKFFGGENYHEVGNLYCNLGHVYKQQGDSSKALENYERSRAIYARVHGKAESVDNGDLLTCIGVLYENEGKVAKALEAYENALQVYKVALESDRDPNISELALKMIPLYIKQGEHEKANALKDLLSLK